MPDSSKAKSKLILLESDSATIQRFVRTASRLYEVVIERSASQAVALATADPSVGVFVAGASDEPPSSVLERVKSARADVLRVLLTEPTDLVSIVEGLHSGAIERTIQKPLEVDEVLSALAATSRHAILAGAGVGASHASVR